MKQKFLSGVTLAALTLLVALPLLFILLQAIFPHFSAGSLHDAFGGVSPLLADPSCRRCSAVRCGLPAAWRWPA